MRTGVRDKGEGRKGSEDVREREGSEDGREIIRQGGQLLV